MKTLDQVNALSLQVLWRSRDVPSIHLVARNAADEPYKSRDAMVSCDVVHAATETANWR
jgi:hypothetical protein